MKAKISFIGSGNLATHLANAFDLSGYTIHQIISRNESTGKTLAAKYSAFFDTKSQNIDTSSDYVFIAISDNNIESVIKDIITEKPLFVHCAGSVSLNTIAVYKPNTAIFYPLQTFTKNRNLNYFEIPVFIEANNELNLKKIKQLADSFSNNVNELNSAKRLILHLSAVVSNNFTNHLIYESEKLLHNENMPLKWLYPLLSETIQKAFEFGPGNSQTGPAARNDEKTLKLHLDILDNQQSLKEIYKIISEQIKNKTT